MKFNESEKNIALKCAANGCDFMFIPSTDLCEKIVKGDSRAKGINKAMTTIILKRNPIRLDTEMVIKYCLGTLDKKNTWLFDNGDIEVVPPRFKKPTQLKEKEEEKEN